MFCKWSGASLRAVCIRLTKHLQHCRLQTCTMLKPWWASALLLFQLLPSTTVCLFTNALIIFKFQLENYIFMYFFFIREACSPYMLTCLSCSDVSYWSKCYYLLNASVVQAHISNGYFHISENGILDFSLRNGNHHLNSTTGVNQPGSGSLTLCRNVRGKIRCYSSKLIENKQFWLEICSQEFVVFFFVTLQ